MTIDPRKIDALIAAVAAGEVPDDGNNGHFRALGFYHMTRAWKAYRGSLDAAKALHEALLPGWIVASIQQLLEIDDDWAYTGNARDWQVELMQLRPRDPLCEDHRACETSETPARAWLLAILHAYRATLEAAHG